MATAHDTVRFSLESPNRDRDSNKSKVLCLHSDAAAALVFTLRGKMNSVPSVRLKEQPPPYAMQLQNPIHKKAKALRTLAVCELFTGFSWLGPACKERKIALSQNA